MKRAVAFFLTILLLFGSSGVPVVYADNGGVMVHRTRTGECYHREGCSYLHSDIPVTLEDAVNIYHLRACSRCDPPTLGEDHTTDTLTYQEYRSVGSSAARGKAASNSSAAPPAPLPQPSESDSGKKKIPGPVAALLVFSGVVVFTFGPSVVLYVATAVFGKSRKPKSHKMRHSG